MFEEKINKEYLNLCHIIYGGEFFLELENYKLKEVNFENSNIIKCVDNLLSQRGNNDFYCYKSKQVVLAHVCLKVLKQMNLL